MFYSSGDEILAGLLAFRESPVYFFTLIFIYLFICLFVTGFISFSVISQDSSMLLYVIVSLLVKAEEHSIVCIHHHI